MTKQLMLLIVTMGWLAGCGSLQVEVAQQPTAPATAIPETLAPVETPTLILTLPVTETATTPPSGDALCTDFGAKLAEALAARDFPTWRPMLADPFWLDYWGSERGSFPSEMAGSEIQNTFLPENNAAITTTAYTDLSAIIGIDPTQLGMDPKTMWGEGANIVLTLHSTGWGVDTQGEALIAIRWDDPGGCIWHGLLYAHAGFIY